MRSKEKLRKKFIFLRRRKYFLISSNFYKPLLNKIKLHKNKNISLYYPSNYEVDTSHLFKMLKKKGFLSTSLPKLMPNGKMKFVNWRYFDPLKVNKYGFLEPTNNVKSITPDIVIVPLLAFDRFRNRLGYGKGYYDKFISSLKKRKKAVTTVGLAFSFQKYKKIPTTKFDMKLDYILTEKGLF
tara:strand:- start:9955 stop:10503 length:549 start_codon:yes stop_codon:yes gene_type:complete